MATWTFIIAIHLSLKSMTVITEYGKQNIFAKETPPRLMNENEQGFLMEQAERTNGQLAMLGFVAALGAYITTGQIIPGIF